MSGKTVKTEKVGDLLDKDGKQLREPRNLNEAMLVPLNPAEDMKKYNLDSLTPVLLNLLRREPFLGMISMNITKQADYKFRTAYVGVRPNGKMNEIFMGFSPKFMHFLNDQQREGVIRHELYHLIFQHIFTRAVGDRSYDKMWNWATDLAINSIIGKENLPELCLIPGTHPLDPKTGKPIEGEYAEFIKNAPSDKSSDYYFNELKKVQEKLGDQNNEIAIASGIDSMDSHGEWGDLPQEIQDQISDRVRDMMNKAAKEAIRSNSWGTVPQEIQGIITKMLSREVDWASIVKSFLGRCRTQERSSTIRKINKKMPYIHPGVRRPLRAKFACFIDQSGSMSDEDIAQLFGELESFANETELDVYHFDTEIDKQSHTVWKKSQPFPKAHRTRMGGTDFQAVADFCNNRENRGRWSGVVILTDGYAPVMGNIVGSRVLWVITETGSKDACRKGDLVVQMKQEKQFKTY